MMLFNIPAVASAFIIFGSTVASWPVNEPRQSNETGTNKTSPDQIGIPAPHPSRPANITAGGVLFCESVNWTNCSYTVLPLNTCLDMREAWNKSISSIGPDNGTVLLTYQEINCNGNGTGWLYPGSSDLMSTGWNDVIVSAKAIEETF